MMMPDVEVRKCKGFPHYYVTEDGRVWSTLRGRFLSPVCVTPRRDYPEQQYLRVKLGGKYCYVHKLVADVWTDAPESGARVRILDRLSLSMGRANLAWENHKDIAPPVRL